MNVPRFESAVFQTRFSESQIQIVRPIRGFKKWDGCDVQTFSQHPMVDRSQFVSLTTVAELWEASRAAVERPVP
jgi:hypothetical protein